MTRARNSAGQAAPPEHPSHREGPPQFSREELEAIYLVLRESYAPSSRYEAQKSVVKKLRVALGFETP